MKMDDPRKRIIGSVLDSGEIIEGHMLVFVPVKRKIQLGEWLSVSQELSIRIANELSYEEFRIFHILLGHLDYGNWIKIKQKDLYSMIGMRQSNFSRGVNSLIEKGYLEQGPQNTLRFNPNMGWKGSVKSHTTELSNRMKLKGFKVVK